MDEEPKLHLKPDKAAQCRERVATQCFMVADTRKMEAKDTVYNENRVSKSQQHGGIKTQAQGTNETTEPKDPSWKWSL